MAAALQSTVVNDYAQRNTLALIGELEAEQSVRVLDQVDANITVVRELRRLVRLEPKDIVDLHILAAIVHDRRQQPEGTALFFSHNKKEFDPKRGKVPEELYRELQLAWSDDFDLPSRVAHWRKLHATPRG